MEAYVIRVYRTAKQLTEGRRSFDCVQINGVIENSETGDRQSFKDIEDLWNILVRDEVRFHDNGN